MTETFTSFGLARPAVGTSKETTPRVLTASFGDGYAQRVGDGINTMEEKSSVVFEAMTAAETRETEAFFIQHGGYKSFFWTFPGEAVQKRWIARSWRVTTVAPDIGSITVELQRVFDNTT